MMKSAFTQSPAETFRPLSVDSRESQAVRDATARRADADRRTIQCIASGSIALFFHPPVTTDRQSVIRLQEALVTDATPANLVGNTLEITDAQLDPNGIVALGAYVLSELGVAGRNCDIGLRQPDTPIQD